MPSPSWRLGAGAVVLLAVGVVLVRMERPPREPEPAPPTTASEPAPVASEPPAKPVEMATVSARLVQSGTDDKPEPGVPCVVFAGSPPPTGTSRGPTTLEPTSGDAARARRAARAECFMASAETCKELGEGRSDAEGYVKISVPRAALAAARTLVVAAFTPGDGAARGASWSPSDRNPGRATGPDLGELELQPLRRAVVTVTTGGRPVRDALVVTEPCVSRSNRSRSSNGASDAGTTDANGVVSLLVETYSAVHVLAPGLADRTLRLPDAGPDGSVRATVELERGSSLRGRVLDMAGEPIADEVVDVSVDAERPNVLRRTSAEGVFVFEGLVAGQDYGLEVGKRELVHAVAGGPEVTIKIETSGSLVARLKGDVNPDWPPTWNLEKEAAPGTWNSLRHDVGGPEKTFGPLVPGVYRVSACDRKHYGLSAPVQVGAGPATSVSVSFATRRVDVALEFPGPMPKAAALVEVFFMDRRNFLDRIFDGEPAGRIVFGKLTIPTAPTSGFTLRVKAEGALDATVPVPAGADATSVTVPVRPGRKLRVVLQDETGKRIAGKLTWKELHGVEASLFEESFEEGIAEVVVSRAPVELLATPNDRALAPARGVLEAGADPGSLTLLCAGMRKVKVAPTLAAGSEPAGRAWLSWRTADGRTDIDRLFDDPPWTIPAPPDAVTIRVRAWGFLATEVAVPAGGDVEVPVALEPGVGLESQLVDAAHRPVPGGTVVITTPGSHDEKIDAGSAGSFGWGIWLRRGAWRVRVTAPGYVERTILLREGEEFPKLIVLERSR
ncbi:MAG TPA: carboxypeptidase-like regulatory domain-containing protein [Planctomycetota bacterium]|nr:carboxypeptidase-like regulatory domain-containing protein [Planctomycetota bacterium]